MTAAPHTGHTPAYGSVDLTNCEDEPIHIPGAIQPHGCLLALDPATLEVAVASANTGELLGTDPAAAIGRPLADLLGPTVATDVRRRWAEEAFNEPMIVRLPDARGGALAGAEVDVSLHRSGERLVVEVEPLGRPRSVLLSYQSARAAMARISAQDLGPGARRAAGPRGRRDHRVRPGDGLPLRPRLERRGDRRGAAPRPQRLPRPALPGGRHPRAGPAALHRQLDPADRRRRLRPGPARAGARPRHGDAPGPLLLHAAQRLPHPPGVPAQHGCHRLHVDLAGRGGRAVGPGRVPPLLRAAPPEPGRPRRGGVPGPGGLPADRGAHPQRRPGARPAERLDPGPDHRPGRGHATPRSTPCSSTPSCSG